MNNQSVLQVFFNDNIDTIVWFAYVVAAVLFIQGLRYMNSPKTARKGNFVSITGMGIAVFFAFVSSIYSGFANIGAFFALIAGIALGTLGGVFSAKKVKMTAMPQLVSIFNTVGGGAAALVAVNDALNPPAAKLPASGLIEGAVKYSDWNAYKSSGSLFKFFTPENVAWLPDAIDHAALLTAVLGMIIGCITFTGSIVAAGKLQGVISGAAIKIPGKSVIYVVCLVGCIVTGAMIVIGNTLGSPIWVIVLLLCLFALIIGLVFALPIGGADMPVVISILNACTGTAVAMAGFVIDNVVMIVAGALVGASGAILSLLMAKAMNRSLVSVLIGGFGGDDATDGADGPAQVTKETTADDVAVQMSYASKVIIVPGYGLAVAGAQHEIADLTKLLEDKGVEVMFAIHPVAGRMPGHMNVLLAEANISYDKLVDMDDVNPQFAQADVAFVVGANDVTNPAARRAGTPISGMPILDVDAAKSVVVNKRGRGKGYAGIENELYGLGQTSMLYGDAKSAIADVIAAVKEL
ncbi:NAD(P) transhydrogenase subunit beta [Actinomycetota bacterium]|nr:NAD(P) transhydrogenase subunit beta [Actinomycetota bacterium]